MEHSLANEEIEAWVQGLANTDHARIRVILDLLKHKTGDGMSAEDERICKRMVEKLRRRLADKEVERRARNRESDVPSATTLENLRSGWGKPVRL